MTEESKKRDEAIAVDPSKQKRVVQANTFGRKVLAAFLPHVQLPNRAREIITLTQVWFAIIFWLLIPESTFPGPISIANALRDLWLNNALGREMIVSLTLNLYLIANLILIGIMVAVMQSLSATKGLVKVIGTFRFLGLTGLTLIFTLYTSGAISLRLSILTFVVGAFYATSVASIVEAVPQGRRDYMRTLGMSEWQAMYEIDIRGNALEMWDALRQNQAMGWGMLVAVEGITKSAGGVGTLLLNSARTWNLDEVYAIQLSLWGVGLLIDRLFVSGRSMFPWSKAYARRSK